MSPLQAPGPKEGLCPGSGAMPQALCHPALGRQDPQLPCRLTHRTYNASRNRCASFSRAYYLVPLGQDPEVCHLSQGSCVPEMET